MSFANIWLFIVDIPSLTHTTQFTVAFQEVRSVAERNFWDLSEVLFAMSKSGSVFLIE